MDLQCELNDQYEGCIHIDKVTILQRCELQAINGRQADQFSNVRVLTFRSSKMHYLPSGLHKFFPQLRKLRVTDCGLKEITSKVLFGLNDLTSLIVIINDVKTLPDDLFIHTRKLEWISFLNNNLKYVSSHLFDPFPENQLKCVDLRGQGKVCEIFFEPTTKDEDIVFPVTLNFETTVDTLEKLKYTIDSSCSAPIRPSTRKSLSKPSSNNFKQFWNLKDLSDFTIITGTKEIFVHKVVLAAQSSVFVSIFKNDVRVRASNKLKIKDATEEGVLKFLRAIYTGEIDNRANALELFTLASIFGVEAIEIACEDDVIEQLNEDNAMDGLKVGNLYKSEVIIEAAFREIQEMLPDELHLDLKLQPEKVELILTNFKAYKELLK